MIQQTTHRISKLHYAMLPLVIALALYLAFVPHLNYPYPLHLDEWIHLASSNEIIKEASAVNLSSPFSGGGAEFNQVVEVGFHVFWAVFYQISGISWLVIYKYFPGIVFIITVLSVYVLAQREGFGLEAAFFTSLIPTGVGTLGPAFMVPLAMGLLFIPLSIFIVFHFRSWWSYLVLFMFTFFLVSLHAATAVGLVIILTPFIILNLKGSVKHSVVMMLGLLAPFLILFPLIVGRLMPTMKSLLTPSPLPTFVSLPQLIPTYGYLPVLFCLVGVLLLAMRMGKNNYGLVFGLLAMLAMLVTYFTFHFGLPIMYYRGIVITMLIVSVFAGAGLAGIRRLRLLARLGAWLKVPFITENTGNILCLVLIGVTLAMVIPVRQNALYYHMIDDEDYQVFVWIRDNVSEGHKKAILDPWKGTAFTAITGKQIYSRIAEYPTDRDVAAQDFLSAGANATSFMRENGLSMVYTRGEVRNPDLVEVRQYVYLLKQTQRGK